MDAMYSADQIEVPSEFPAVLKAYAKEVIRFRPSNILLFSRNYFDAMCKGELEQFLASYKEDKKLKEGKSGAGSDTDTVSSKEKALAEAFKSFDRDGNGYVTKDELIQVLASQGLRASEADVDAMIAQADRDADGRVNYNEYIGVMMGAQ